MGSALTAYEDLLHRMSHSNHLTERRDTFCAMLDHLVGLHPACKTEDPTHALTMHGLFVFCLHCRSSISVDPAIEQGPG